MLDQTIGRAERTVDGSHECPTEHGENGSRRAIAGLDQCEFRPGCIEWEVGRSEYPVGGLEDLEDLVLAVDMVAHGHRIDAGISQLFEATNGQSRAAGGVFRIADDQSDLPPRNQPWQGLADDLTSWRTNDIADEQDIE